MTKTSDQWIVRTAFFPRYGEVQRLMPVLDNHATKSECNALDKAIWDQTGTPKNPVDWSDPDEWIEERLKGANRELAKRIWQGTEKLVNPRYLYGAYMLMANHGLMQMAADEPFHLTEAGQKFIDNDAATLRGIDELEGIPQLLAILAAHSPAKRADLIGEWQEFLFAHSKYTSRNSVEGALRERLLNVIDRGYVVREGNTYTISESGLKYAAQDDSPFHDVLQSIKIYNDRQTEELRERLATMNPYRFEVLVKDLLEAMDYEDVEVTKQSGDKGIDVVAHFQFGITRIREVVQVKRWQDSVTRPTIDQLRGALPYHQALRGTIITLGKFSKGCKEAALFPGAAPITLIDGDMLIDLLLKHEVGIGKQKQALLSVDEDYFSDTAPEPPVE
jgi:restriction system protein